MKNVVISIKGLTDLDNPGDSSVEFVTDGEYEYLDGNVDFSYQESELTGLEGTKTSFHITKENVIMTRSGTLDAQIVFEEGKKYYFVYATPYGKLSMGVETHSITSRLEENGGYLEIRYLIDMANTVVNRNVFKINITEIRNDN